MLNVRGEREGPCGGRSRRIAGTQRTGSNIPAPKEHPAQKRENVVNLMDALKRSIAAEKQASAPAKKGRKRVEGQREMLLPITGKKQPAAPRAVARPQARQKKAG